MTYNVTCTIQNSTVDVVKIPIVAFLRVVDCESADRTIDKVIRFGLTDNRGQLIPAVWSGLGRSIAPNCSNIVNKDANGSYLASNIPRLVDAASRADLVIALRCVTGGSTTGWPEVQQLIGRGCNAYAAILNGMTVLDIPSGFRCFNVKSAAFATNMPAIRRGFIYHVATATRLNRLVANIVEVPIRFQDRLAGESKL